MGKQERRQDHFNKAYLGVIAQGEPAVWKAQGATNCMYLTKTGSKCGVGHTLTEKELEKYGNYLGSVDYLWQEMKRGGDADEDHHFYHDLDFYQDLQEVHDNLMSYEGGEFVESFKYYMASFAQRYNLTVPDETATA